MNIQKRVRLIIGLNEEKDWKCINYYKEHEEWPIVGFSPDANFPAIFAEKGIMSISLENPFSIKDFEILEINCNNNAINVVPKYCSITLKSTSKTSFEIDNLLNNSIDNLSISKINDDTIKIEAFGIASHAAHPELGKNAIKLLVEFLLANFEFEEFDENADGTDLTIAPNLGQLYRLAVSGASQKEIDKAYKDIIKESFRN